MTAESYIHEKGKFSLIDLMEIAKNLPDFHRVGAITVFVGVVRGETSTGETVEKLELDSYEEKANEVLSKICAELRKKKDVIDVQIHHLVGELDVGDDIVYVLVAGSKRSNVFSVLEEAVKRFKSEAPIFKKEYVIGKKGEKKTRWVSEHEKFSSH